MANITLDFMNFMDDDGNFDSQIVHELTRGLGITFSDVEDINATKSKHSGIVSAIIVKFIGSYEDLVTLIDRYEEDPGLRPGLITCIKNINA